MHGPLGPWSSLRTNIAFYQLTAASTQRMCLVMALAKGRGTLCCSKVLAETPCHRVAAQRTHLESGYLTIHTKLQYYYDEHDRED